MVASKGRPKSENPKDFMLRIRVDQPTLKKLDAVCDALKLSRSEVVRKGIDGQYDQIKK